MAFVMDSCALKLKDEVYGDVDCMESNSSSESYGSPDERKSKSGSSYESGSGGSPDELKSKFESDSNSGVEIIDEGFAELAAMDVCDEKDYDGLVLSPRTAEAWAAEFRENNDKYPERYSDWWKLSDLNRNKEDDIIDPQVWEAAERLYGEQIRASKGFDVDDFTGRYCAFGIIQPLPNFKEERAFEIILKLSVLATEKYNSENGTKYQFIEVEKVNSRLAGDFIYYITFKAKQVADVHDETTFQAVGYYGFPTGELSVDNCRLKTTN